MKCAKCGHDNRTGAKFCEECGAHLSAVCANCGAQLSPTAKFCSECGHPIGQTVASGPHSAPRFAAPEAYTPRHLAEKILTSKAALEGERKQVTVLFADLKGSMELFADRDPEEARRLLDPVLEQMMEAVHRYEGTVNQVMGDGIMALFGAPLAQEDHAVRACYAALGMQETASATPKKCTHEGIPIQIRVGLNSGRGGRALDRQRPADGLHRGRARPPTWPRAWSRWRARVDTDLRRHPALAEGYFGKSARPVDGERA